MCSCAEETKDQETSIISTKVGSVSHVIDGDTFAFKDSIKTSIIRLAGIDAPELRQAFGNESKVALTNILGLKENSLRIDIIFVDKYGRLIARVYLNDTLDVNLYMVKNGFAWHFSKYSTDTLFSNAQEFAKKNKLNLWSGNNIIEPSEFRKRAVSK
jgi:micrococcal nuclease